MKRLEHLEELDAALRLKSKPERSRSNGSAPGGPRAKAGRGGDASTRVKPLDEKGGEFCPKCHIGTNFHIHAPMCGHADCPYKLENFCKGSYLTKTACKVCFRCTQEKSMLFRNYRLGFRTYQEMLDLGFKPLEIEGALNNE